MIFVESEENSLEQEVIRRLVEECHSPNTEANRLHADNILCEFLKALGYTDIVSAYISIYKDYY